MKKEKLTPGEQELKIISEWLAKEHTDQVIRRLAEYVSEAQVILPLSTPGHALMFPTDLTGFWQYDPTVLTDDDGKTELYTTMLSVDTAVLGTFLCPEVQD